MIARAIELRHGYTLTDLERLAKIAVARDFWHQGMHPADRFDLSFSAMAEHLYAADQRPTANDLFSAATTAVRRHAQSDRSRRARHHPRHLLRTTCPTHAAPSTSSGTKAKNPPGCGQQTAEGPTEPASTSCTASSGAAHATAPHRAAASSELPSPYCFPAEP
jgi:hypothetical protein